MTLSTLLETPHDDDKVRLTIRRRNHLEIMVNLLLYFDSKCIISCHRAVVVRCRLRCRVLAARRCWGPFRKQFKSKVDDTTRNVVLLQLAEPGYARLLNSSTELHPKNTDQTNSNVQKSNQGRQGGKITGTGEGVNFFRNRTCTIKVVTELCNERRTITPV